MQSSNKTESHGNPDLEKLNEEYKKKINKNKTHEQIKNWFNNNYVGLICLFVFFFACLIIFYSSKRINYYFTHHVNIPKFFQKCSDIIRDIVSKSEAKATPEPEPEPEPHCSQCCNNITCIYNIICCIIQRTPTTDNIPTAQGIELSENDNNLEQTAQVVKLPDSHPIDIGQPITPTAPQIND